jgi:hypothetical protein
MTERGWSPGAEAGMRQINTGSSGCPLVELNDHEVTDLVLSGRAFGRVVNLDGTRTMVELVDRTGQLQRLAGLWRDDGTLGSIK